ncbi:MAG: DNA repair protein RadC [Planctomycetota bacterium]|nr:DNA repair protein RadC [Planctomycetota bacterium]
MPQARSAGEPKPHYLGHRARLRDRFTRTEGAGLEEYEALELLLTYAVPRVDLKRVAKDLLKRFGSFAAVLDAKDHELRSVKGITPRSAVLLRLVKRCCEEYMAEGLKQKDLFAAPDAVVDFARARLAGAQNENFLVIFLNSKHELLDYMVVHEGTVDRAVVHPRRVVEEALRHHAAGLILVHNHPSGHAAPSPEDRQITQAVVSAARTMDIAVLDHIIIAREEHVSFAQEGLL